MKDDFIVLENVCKSYSNQKAVDNVSFKIKEGELVVILGNSGCGKTTLLNMIGALDLPDSGKITVNGLCISDAEEKIRTCFRFDDVGFVFQSFNLINELTALENVALVSDKTLAEKALKDVGLEDCLNKYPLQLSGGQQQRVSIARALAKKKELIICDEPTGALDYESGKNVLSCILDSAKKNNLTTILVTHTREIASLADHVIVIKNGHVEKEYYNKEKANVVNITW